MRVQNDSIWSPPSSLRFRSFLKQNPLRSQPSLWLSTLIIVSTPFLPESITALRFHKWVNFAVWQPDFMVEANPHGWNGCGRMRVDPWWLLMWRWGHKRSAKVALGRPTKLRMMTPDLKWKKLIGFKRIGRMLWRSPKGKDMTRQICFFSSQRTRWGYWKPTPLNLFHIISNSIIQFHWRLEQQTKIRISSP